jgi:hypothetical protein
LRATIQAALASEGIQEFVSLTPTSKTYNWLLPCTAVHCCTALYLKPKPCVLLQVENEDLVFTLEVMVEKFGDEIAPYAVSPPAQLAWLVVTMFS